MIFSDRILKERGPELIEPFSEELVQPASYEVTLAPDYKELSCPYFNPFEERDEDRARFDYMHKTIHPPGIYIEPGRLYLFSTVEKVKVPNGMVVEVTGKSSLARIGLKIHQTAGFVDPGFEGTITLEVESVSTHVLVRPGMKIAQLVFHECYESDNLYGSCNNHYMNQSGATLPRFNKWSTHPYTTKQN